MLQKQTWEIVHLLSRLDHEVKKLHRFLVLPEDEGSML